MELDFKSIKALSSPTRLKILKKVLEKESTTTKLSEDLGKSKSTISTHLNDLTDAGLLEKDKEDGRRRVVYRPTRKAEAIVKGKERKVKFSVASSVFSTVAGAFLVWKDFTEKSSKQLQSPQVEPESSGGEMGAFNTMDTNSTGEAANQTAQRAAEAAQGSGFEEFFLLAGVFFFGIAASSMIYALTIRHLGPEEDEEKESKKLEVT